LAVSPDVCFLSTFALLTILLPIDGCASPLPSHRMMGDLAAGAGSRKWLVWVSIVMLMISVLGHKFYCLADVYAFHWVQIIRSPLLFDIVAYLIWVITLWWQS